MKNPYIVLFFVRFTPRWLVSLCGAILMANASQKGNTNLSTVTLAEALRLWEQGGKNA